MKELDNVLNFADNMATQLVFGTRKKMKNSSGKSSQAQAKLKEAYLKKKAVLAKYMKSAPFARLWNKWFFVIGVMTVIVHAFMLGRYPHSFYYDFHCVFCTSMVMGKWLYYKSRGWHYYMTDWCYTANALLVLFLTF